jgi:hypothetical protein
MVERGFCRQLFRDDRGPPPVFCAKTGENRGKSPFTEQRSSPSAAPEAAADMGKETRLSASPTSDSLEEFLLSRNDRTGNVQTTSRPEGGTIRIGQQ